MKAVKYMMQAQKSVWGVTIRLLDREAATLAMSYTFTGFTVDDAVAHANKKLAPFGYEVVGAATEKEIDAYYDS